MLNGIYMHNDSTAREGRFSFEPDMQLSFFENHEDEMQLEAAMVDIRNKYGKNAMLKGFNLFDKTTGIKRNTMVGGHNG